jgi:hypothetical protein
MKLIKIYMYPIPSHDILFYFYFISNNLNDEIQYDFVPFHTTISPSMYKIQNAEQLALVIFVTIQTYYGI